VQLCYAGSQEVTLGGYEVTPGKDIMDDSLTKWFVGAGLAAMTAILAFLLKWVFGKLTSGIEDLRKEMAATATRDEAGHEKIASEIRSLTNTVQKQDMSIAMVQRDMQYMQKELSQLRDEFEAHREHAKG
jgi:HAMP domain-containing protein